MSKEVRYAAVRDEGSYGATIMGRGETLEKAYDNLVEQFDTLGENKPNADDVDYFELKPINVDVEQTVKITRRMGR